MKHKSATAAPWQCVLRFGSPENGVGLEDLNRYFVTRWKQPGPVADMDETGLDVVGDSELECFRDSAAECDKPPAFVDRPIERYRPLMKSGYGFYTRPHPEYEHPGWLKESTWTPERRLNLHKE